MINAFIAYRKIHVIIYNMKKSKLSEFQKWADLGLIVKDGHGVNINKWIFALKLKKLHTEEGIMKMRLIK